MSDYTIKFPLEFNNISSGFETINEENLNELVIFNLKNIILTNPGERIMDAKFGLGIKRYLFEQETTSFEEVSFSLKNQVKKYAPYIKILDLQINVLENSMSVSVRYEVPKAQISDTLDLEIEL